MLSIRNKEPWCFWPTRVCKEFYKLPGNAVLSGKYNFEFELDFTIRKVYEDKQLYLLFFLFILHSITIMNICQTLMFKLKMV